MIGCFFTLFITAVLVFFMTCSQFPGTAQLQSTSLLPLSHGFANAFHISVLQSSWFSLPAIYGTALGFLWICGRQFTALGKSGLLLPVISNYMKFNDLLGESKSNSFSASFSSSSSSSAFSASTVGLLIGTVCSLILVVIIHFGFQNDIRILADICFLGAYFQYLLLLFSYLTMKKKYTLLERHFFSPMGNVGAVLGIVLFSVGVISIIFFRTRVNYAVEGFLGIMVVLLLCYVGLIQKHQTFSLDEQKNMFSAYLINGKNLTLSTLVFFLTVNFFSSV
jgi:amino acid transporter